MNKGLGGFLLGVLAVAGTAAFIAIFVKKKFSKKQDIDFDEFDDVVDDSDDYEDFFTDEDDEEENTAPVAEAPVADEAPVSDEATDDKETEAQL